MKKWIVLTITSGLIGILLLFLPMFFYRFHFWFYPAHIITYIIIGISAIWSIGNMFLNQSIKNKLHLHVSIISVMLLSPVILALISERESTEPSKKAVRLTIVLEDYKDSVEYYPKSLKELNDSFLTKEFTYNPDTSQLSYRLEYFNKSGYLMIYNTSSKEWYEFTD